MNVKILVVAAVLASPAMVLANAPKTGAAKATTAGTAKDMSYTWTLTGVTAQNKGTIETAIKNLNGVSNVILTETGSLTVHTSMAKDAIQKDIIAALPTGVSAK